jgi:hypothetical protein
MNSILFVHTLPKDYTPYKRLDFCSNALIDTRFIFDDNKFYPLLIGVGEHIPRIWMFMRTRENKVITIVDDNRPMFPRTNISVSQKDRILSIAFVNNDGKTSMLEVSYKSKVPKVTLVDLRPLGYKILGNSEALHIGAIKYSGNIIQSATFIRFSKK